MLGKHLSHREKSMFYLAGVAIFGVIIYMTIIDPLWAYWKELNETISAKEVQVLKNIKILAQRDAIDTVYAKYSESIKMKGSEEEETAVILREIENIARSANVYITDIKPQKAKDMEFYKEYHVELEAEGNISSLTKFIYELQNSKQILKVKRLQLTPKAEAGDVLKGDMVVTKILLP